MSKLFYNPNPEFGEGGPFKAESKEALADEMRDCFKRWAEEVWLNDDDALGDKKEYMELEISKMRKSFIDGLEEVEDNS
jgi:hypothetical protein